MQADRGLSRLLVTSAVSGEGRTLTALNTALGLSSFPERRVLLVDADVRRPSLQRMLRLTAARGLTDVLLGKCDDVPLVRVTPHLTVLPAGQPDADAMAALTSDRMEWLVAQFGTHFDWILIDSPPVGALPDPQLLARMAGAVLFVVKAGRTSHRDVLSAIELLGPDSVIGTVLNRARPEDIFATPLPLAHAVDLAVGPPIDAPAGSGLGVRL